MNVRRALTTSAALLLAGLVVPVTTATPAAAANCGFLTACYAPETILDFTAGTPAEAGFTAETINRNAAFSVGVADTTDTNITYECLLQKEGGPAAAWSSCTVPVTYPDLALGGYSFSARSTKNPEASDLLATPTPVDQRKVVTFRWDIVAPIGSNPDEPVTRLLETPGRWLLDSVFSVDIAANRSIDGARCTMDGKVKACNYRQFDTVVRSGTHTATVAAMAGTHIDRTPAVVRFAVPKQASKLKGYRGGWDRRTGYDYYQDQVAITRNKGASFTTGFDKQHHIALVLSTGPGNGKIAVYLKGRLVKKINLGTRARHNRVLVPIKNSKKPMGGQLKIVVLSKNKPVYFEGLALSRHK